MLVCQDFETETSKLGLPLVNWASACLVLRGDWVSRQIFAEHGPDSFDAATSIVAADELKLGRRLLLCGICRIPP